MANIPAFQDHHAAAYSFLPPGKHKATPKQIEDHFVTPYLLSSSRQEIFTGWKMFRNLMHNLLPIEKEYLDGSFVTSKIDPKDADISFWVSAIELDRLSSTEQQELMRILDKRVQSLLRCDVYIVPVCGQGHASYGAFQKMLWTEEYWAACRDSQGGILGNVEKGYIEVLS